jgi:signal recognition particle GTPase
MDKITKDELLLTQLILMFQTSAMQSMGKLKNPVTDKIEKNLGQAQISIDMLDMLHKKMKNNLSQEEERMLSGVIKELKLNYVDEMNKSQSSAADKEEKPPPQTSEGGS